MKQFLKIIFLFSILLTSFENIYPQIPQYRLDVKNFTLVNPYRMTFDIFLTHTDNTLFELAGHQYYFRVPQSIGTLGIGTGTNSGYQHDSLNGNPITDFIYSSWWPRNPSVASIVYNGVSMYELRLFPNSIPGLGGMIIEPGASLLIFRMKLISSTPFNLFEFPFVVRDSCNDIPLVMQRVKINAYVYIYNTEITRCRNHHVDVSGINPTNIVCNIKLGIEGLYNSNTDKLRKRDTVSAYLRNVNSPYNIIDSARALVDSNFFTGNFSFANTSLSGLYYIVVKYKNAIETWSRAGADPLSVGIINIYDFTDSASKAFGNNLVLKGSKYCIFSGDVNYDNIIDLNDMSAIDNDAIKLLQGNLITDLDGNNIVDIQDLAIADNNVASYVVVVRP